MKQSNKYIKPMFQSPKNTWRASLKLNVPKTKVRKILEKVCDLSSADYAVATTLINKDVEIRLE